MRHILFGISFFAISACNMEEENKRRIKFEKSMNDTSIHIENKNNVPKNITKAMVMHSDLKDCQVYEIASNGEYCTPRLYITRCPDSHTSTTTGEKHSVTVESN